MAGNFWKILMYQGPILDFNFIITVLLVLVAIVFVLAVATFFLFTIYFYIYPQNTKITLTLRHLIDFALEKVCLSKERLEALKKQIQENLNFFVAYKMAREIFFCVFFISLTPYL